MNRKVLSLFALLTAITFVWIWKSKEEQTSKAQAAKMTREEVVYAYLSGHQRHTDTYWLTGQEDDTNWRQKTQAWREKAQGLIRTYKDVSPETQAIYARFQTFFVSSMDEHGNCSKRGQVMQAPPGQFWRTHRGIDVCLAGANLAEQYARSPVMYNGGGMLVLAMEMPPELLASFLFHELGHAHRQLVQNHPSSGAPDMSDLMIDEEVAMLATEYAVLNAAFLGKVNSLYSDILGRTNAKELRVVAESVVTADLAKYDVILGTTQVGYPLARLLSMEFYIGLGRYTLTQTGQDGESARAAERHYFRWVLGRNATQ